ncbi:juvenile hormone acid O-methyltransferase-like [Argiope bruennichi]|uniref:juvenile hormone acid O-methyltransferase-like n=1 Tax=Argiope bruennichi TaxID=94029 RepID=UPI002493E518|nr:juvenile hormone acid O-methyltransferase-like [Argiope bruennichi]
MSLNFRPQDYTQWHSPLETVRDFFNGILTTLDWNKSNGNDIIMDIGCGPGGTTRDIILPFFSEVQKIIALDVTPGMINIAKKKNAHPRIEYIVADISEWNTVECWEEKIAKIVSIHCFQWVKYQEKAFQNAYRLLKPGGEAAFFFAMEASFFDVIERLQNNPKWSQYLKDRDNRIPDSHYRKCGASYFQKLLEGFGFEILYCKEEEKIDACSSDETIKNFCSSLCVLEPYIPEEHKEDFKNDIVQELVKINGRTENGLPCHKGKMLEVIVKKK